MRHRVPDVRAARITSLVVLGFGVAASAIESQTATLTAPDRTVVGSSIALTWTGPSAASEFISIDPVGAPATQYGTYVYTNAAQPATLRVPDVPGAYVLRYHLGTAGYPVVASRPIEVADVEATFDVLVPVDAGAPVSVVWRGPAYPGDFISIDAVGAPDSQYGPYAYTAASRAPAAPTWRSPSPRWLPRRPRRASGPSRP